MEVYLCYMKIWVVIYNWGSLRVEINLYLYEILNFWSVVYIYSMFKNIIVES